MTDRVITPRDDEWPALLNELGPNRPPRQLFVRGLTLKVGPRTIAVVGARHPTAAGLEAAHRLARGLSEAGFTIVSGLALGIDAAAHRAALDAGGYTIAVLGCGLDVDYPRRNSQLKREIERRGTIVTEYEPGTQPSAFHFPERNRILAGLASGTVFVEGGARSGGRITARAALDANRAVFAVPGSIRNRLADGPNELIRTSQAALITHVKHICDELEPDLVWDDRDEVGTRASIELEDTELRVLRFLDDAPIPSDVVCSRLEMKPGELALALSRLEIRGLAVRRRDGYEVTTAGARARDEATRPADVRADR